jgi:predicted glycosyltransferase
MKVRIWFDISNSPHINFFAAMIRELKDEHEIIITCRPLANTIDLLELHGFAYQNVGVHYGKNIFKKVLGYPIRVYQLNSYLKKNKPDVAISHSSFHSPVTARLLNCRSIYLNDNEHAMGNIPSFLFANTVMIPEFLDRRRMQKQGARDSKIVQYPGVKEGIYLWQLSELQSSSGVRNNTSREKVYIRPEPWTAQYYKGSVNFMDDILLGLKDKVDVVISPRGDLQTKHYHDPKFAGVRILDKPLGLSEIAEDCSMFIGAGGTMTREMAVLGIPTISVYQDDLLDVDRYLINEGQMIHKPDLKAEFALQYLEDCERKPPRSELLQKGRQAYELIKAVLLGDKPPQPGVNQDD